MARTPNVNQLFAEQFSFRAPVTPQRLAMPPQETLQAAPVSWRDRLKDALGGVIGRHNAEMAVQLADFTPLGVVFAGNEARLAANRGGYGEAAAGAAMAALPIPGARGVGKVAREVVQEVPTITTRALAMDEASRMARAREMGFDTSRPLYHGTKSAEPLTEFDRGKSVTARGLFFTPDKEAADSYAASGSAEPFFARAGKQAQLTPDSYDPATLKAAKAAYRAQGGKNSGWDTFEDFWDHLTSGEMYQYGGGQSFQNEILSHFEDRGFNSVRMTDAVPGGGYNESVVMFDPARLRRPEAAFDPAKRNSKNLMAGVAGAGVTGAATITTRSQPKDDKGI